MTRDEAEDATSSTDVGQESASEPGVLVSMILGSFNAPGDLAPPSNGEELAASVSQAWQQLGSQGSYYEIKGSIAGVEEGRLHELMGLAGATGEYLGLALTASRDLGRWLSASDVDDAWGMSTRAATERLVGYLHAASHHLGNVTLRAMLVRPHADSRLRAQEAQRLVKHPATTPMWEPYSRQPGSFPALNRDQAKTLRQEARLHSSPALLPLAVAVSAVTADDAWEAMVSRRNDEYHRWRLQSVPGADADSNPWKHDGAERSLSFGMPAAAPFDPSDTLRLAEEARHNLAVLAEAMDTWYDAWQALEDDLIGS